MLNHDPISTLSYSLLHPRSSYTTYTPNQQKKHKPHLKFSRILPVAPPNPTLKTPPKLHIIHGAMTLLSINSTGGHFTLSLSRSQHKKSQEWKSVSSWLVTAPTQPTPLWRCFKVYEFVCYPGLAQKKVGVASGKE